MSERTLEGLRRDLREKCLYQVTLADLHDLCSRFWQIVDGMEHEKEYPDWADSPHAYESCKKCALEKIGGERR